MNNQKQDLFQQYKSEIDEILFEKIEINGVTGYLKSIKSDGTENSVIEDAELHWFADGVHYSIVGTISNDEAIKIAKSAV